MSGDRAWTTRARAWLKARSVRQLALLAGAVVLLVSGLFGGLRAATPDEIESLDVGRGHVLEPFTLTVERARWTADLTPIGVTERGRFLVVVATISTDATRSVDPYVVQEALQLRGQRGIFTSESGDEVERSESVDPAVYVLEDGTRLSGIGPGLTYDVVFVWEQREAEPVPTTLALAGRRHTFRQSSIDTQENWFDPQVKAVGSIAVTKVVDP